MEMIITCQSFISIHAPLTGCGKKTLILSATQLYFNPRTPYGMRRAVNGLKRLQARFQSTHPLRDATQEKATTETVIQYFNPRTPYGMRLKFRNTKAKPYSISIHAPLTGCDWEKLHCISFYYDFNPRTPYGMRP